MNKLLRAWFGVREPVSRKEYLASGLLLALVVLEIELALVQAWFGQVPAPFAFLTPLFEDAARILVDAPDEASWWTIALTLPFVWVGVSMSVRRALDAGLPPALGFLFPIPGVGCLLALALCIAPTKPATVARPATGAYRSAPAQRALEKEAPGGALRIARRALLFAAVGFGVLGLRGCWRPSSEDRPAVTRGWLVLRQHPALLAPPATPTASPLWAAPRGGLERVDWTSPGAALFLATPLVMAVAGALFYRAARLGAPAQPAPAPPPVAAPAHGPEARRHGGRAKLVAMACGLAAVALAGVALRCWGREGLTYLTMALVPASLVAPLCAVLAVEIRAMSALPACSSPAEILRRPIAVSRPRALQDVRTSVRALMFHARPALMGLAVVLAQGTSDWTRSSLRFSRTEDLHASPEVLTLVETLADARASYDEGFPTLRHLLRLLDREQAHALLTHESPIIRSYISWHVVETWPEDAALVYQLLDDDGFVPLRVDCTQFGSYVSGNVVVTLCKRVETPAVQEVLLRAAADRDLRTRTRNAALHCVAPHRPEEAARILAAARRQHDPLMLVPCHEPCWFPLPKQAGQDAWR